MKGILAIGVLALVLVGGYFLMYVSSNASEQRLRITCKNQEKNAEQVMANGKNKVQEGAFLQVGEKTIQGRVGGGSFAKSMTEAGITFPTSTYEKVMTVIEEFRNKYEHEQTKLLALKTEHDSLVVHPFYSLFIKNTSPVEVVIVTSSQAREAYETGLDNDTNPYDNK